jgi:asparagine synthase (glutamine-hydrolysing)
MVGLCGIVGQCGGGLEPLADRVAIGPAERQTTYRDDGISVQISSHAHFHEDQPASADDGTLVWVLGDPYGFEGPDGYEPRTDFSVTDAAYCADLFSEYGMEFVAGLNGEFAGLVFKRDDDEVHLFTDRLGSRPLFYTRTDDCLRFSSRLQSIGMHPDVTPAFDCESLAEFFAVQKAFGRATPLADVWKVPPASVLSVRADGSIDGRQTYWQPKYRPVDRSPTELAKDVVETFRDVFRERVRDDLDYGVMVSGGSDSRLVLGAMTERDRYPTAFHMTNWMSREARTAERVAHAAGVDFQLLRRDADYHEGLLDTVPRFSNFVGAFDESIASGFRDELSSVDVVLTGYLGDTVFGVYPLYLLNSFRFVSLINRFSPVFERQIGSTTEYIRRYLDRYSPPATVPAFLDVPDVADVMDRHLRAENGHVRHHGVEYPSLRELQLCEYYPLTNQFASANTDSIRQITGHWSPFFDNRLLDLHLSVPVRHRIRFDPINHALCRLCPSLATIPHAGTGISPAKSIQFGPTWLVRMAGAAMRRRCDDHEPPAPYLDHSPWIDESELIRHHDFLISSIERNLELIETLPFLDGEEIQECCRDHLGGSDHWRPLYALVTLLETPIAERIAAEG